MPFPPQKPKPFERASIEALPPGVVGCYGLFRRDRWIFIGGGDIRQRLLAHLDGERPAVLRQRPTHWVAVETPDHAAMEPELVLACNPILRRPEPRARRTQRLQGTAPAGSGR